MSENNQRGKKKIKIQVCLEKLHINLSYLKEAPGPYGTWIVGTICPMDLVFMSTFNDQSMSIGCVGKLGHLSGFHQHYLIKLD